MEKEAVKRSTGNRKEIGTTKEVRVRLAPLVGIFEESPLNRFPFNPVT